MSRDNVQRFAPLGPPAARSQPPRLCGDAVSFVRGAGHVWGEDDVIHSQQGVVQGERFYSENVEAGTRDPLRAKRVQQSDLVDDLPRETLMRIALGFILSSAAGPIMPRVAG